MSSIDKDQYFRRAEEAWRKWSRLLFLSSRDMELLEELWERDIPLKAVLKAIEEGFISVFKKKRKRMVSLWSLRGRIEKEVRKSLSLEAGKTVKIRRKIPAEYRELLERAYALLEEGKFEQAMALDEEITSRVWEEANQEEREAALNWASERIKNLKVSQEIKEEILLRGAKHRLREKKGIPSLF